MSAARSTLLAVLLALVCVAPATASAATLPADSTAILSGAPSLFDALPAPAGASETDDTAVSYDGRFVAFTSEADGLVDGDDDDVKNVYVKDRDSGEVTWVSRATGAAGAPSHDDCFQPGISDDGKRVAFTCKGSLDPADTGDRTDVYVRDLAANTTTLASRASGLGAVGNRSASRASLSASGEYVVFESFSTNLDPAATDDSPHVFRRQIGGGDATILVSRKATATGASIIGYDASISDDGNKIAFTNYTNNGVDPADTNLGLPDVYVRDVSAGTMTLVSRAPGAGAVGNGASGAGAIAGDGSAVAFESEANNLDNANDNDKRSDIYWRSIGGATNQQNTALVSINAGGTKGDRSEDPSIDKNGNVVAFISQATGLDPADTGPNSDAYAKNVQTNALHVISRADGDDGRVSNTYTTKVAVSGDGTKVAANVGDGSIVPSVDPREPTVVLRDLAVSPRRTFAIARPAGPAPFTNEGGKSSDAALSADGRFAVFTSESRALGVPDGVPAGVFVRDRVTGSVTFASRADGPAGAPFSGLQGPPAISGDGRRVAFTVEFGPDRGVWVRDIVEDRTWLASRADGANGTPADKSSGAPSLSADGSRVSFITSAKNLDAADTDDKTDVYVRDLTADRTILASRADGLAGPKGDGSAFGADLNGDGNRVAFVTSSANLGDGDTDQIADVHVRDLAAGTTTLASAAPDGTKADGGTEEASIDASGTRVAFSSEATNLAGATLPGRKVFVRDLTGGALVLASRADGADGGPVTGDRPRISPDGGYVVFGSDSTGLAPGGLIRVYRRDLAAGQTALVSRRTGADGAPIARPAAADDVSAGGSCVAFATDETQFGPASTLSQVYVRTFRDDCSVPAGDRPGEGPGRLPDDGGAAASDTEPPVLSGARLSNRRFRVARGATAVSARAGLGTVLRFRSSEAATLRITFERRKGKRYRRAGAITRKVRAGSGRVKLTGRLGRRAMRTGAYRVTLVATDAAGNLSKALRLKMSIVR